MTEEPCSFLTYENLESVVRTEGVGVQFIVKILVHGFDNLRFVTTPAMIECSLFVGAWSGTP